MSNPAAASRHRSVRFQPPLRDPRHLRAAIYVVLGVLVTAFSGILLRPPARGANGPSVDAPTPSAVTSPVIGALDGWWSFTNRIESTSSGAFEQLNLEYRVRLDQRGNRVTGTGNKWLENGRRLPRTRRTPIILEGTVNGDRLDLAFSERGAKRTSAGRFDLRVVDDKTLSGTFASDAADSQGTSHVQRLDAEPATQ